MIIRDCQPISFVENEGFRELIKTFDPNYLIPGRKHFSTIYLPRKYAEVKNVLIQKIKINSIWVTLTSDAWTSYSGQCYLSVTCHYLTEEWKREDFFLRLFPLTESHTAKYLNEIITNVLIDFNISPGKMLSLTHDQGSNIKKAAANLPFKSVLCFAHVMQNCIKEAFSGSKRRKIIPNSKINQIIERVRTICRHFKKSTKSSLLLQQSISDLGMVDKKVIIDVITRWDSIHAMLDRFLELKNAIMNCLPKIIREKKNKKVNTKNKNNNNNKNKVELCEFSSTEWMVIEVLKKFTDNVQDNLMMMTMNFGKSSKIPI